MCGFAGFTGYLENGKDVLTDMMNKIIHLFYTGLAQEIGNTVVKMCGTSENSLMFGTTRRSYTSPHICFLAIDHILGFLVETISWSKIRRC